MIEYPIEEIIGGQTYKMLVQIEPAPELRYRWPHIFQVSRWWYEISYWDPRLIDAGSGVRGCFVDLAFEEGGSGGAFTLRRCMMKATEAAKGLAASIHFHRGFNEKGQRCSNEK